MFKQLNDVNFNEKKLIKMIPFLLALGDISSFEF